MVRVGHVVISVRKHSEFDRFEFRTTLERALTDDDALARNDDFFKICAALERRLGKFGKR